MYNHRLVIAGLRQDIEAICKQCKKSPEECKQIREQVEKFDQKYRVLGAWLISRGIPAELTIESIKKYVDSNRFNLDNLRIRKDQIIINDLEFAGEKALQFTEYVHANFPIVEAESQENIEIEDVPVLVGDGIKIYEINDANDARRLVGQDTSWCIGYPGSNNMWQSYRDMYQSTFFVVVDDNPDTPNQRKVAIDFTKNNVLLTDILNRTGTRLSNGEDWEEYSEYLISKGVNLNATRIDLETGEEKKILENKPLNEKEIIQKLTFDLLEYDSLTKEDVELWNSGRSNVRSDDLSQKEYEPYLKNIVVESEYDHYGVISIIVNPDAKYYLSRWVGQGKKIDDDVLESLFTAIGGKNILQKFVNTGIKLVKTQYEKIREDKSLLHSYLRKQIQAYGMKTGITINYAELDDIKKSPDLHKLYFIAIIDSYMLSLEDKEDFEEFIDFCNETNNSDLFQYYIIKLLNQKTDNWLSKTRYEDLRKHDNLLEIYLNEKVKKHLEKRKSENDKYAGYYFSDDELVDLARLNFDDFLMNYITDRNISIYSPFIDKMKQNRNFYYRYLFNRADFITNQEIKELLTYSPDLIFNFFMNSSFNNIMLMFRILENNPQLVESFTNEQLYALINISDAHTYIYMKTIVDDLMKKKPGFGKFLLYRKNIDANIPLKTALDRFDEEFLKSSKIKYVKQAEYYDKIGKYRLADKCFNKIQDLN